MAKMITTEEDRLSWLEAMLQAYCADMNSSDRLTIYTKTTYAAQAAKFVGWVRRQA